MHRVEDFRLESGLAVWLYRSAAESKPLVLFAHGGGFVFGDVETHDGICRRLAALTGAAVLSIDYRRAPEHPGPAAVADLVEAASWVRAGGGELGVDASRLSLAGDSAGGAIALLAAVQLVASGVPLGALLLAYPNAALELNTPSLRHKGHGWGLDAEDLQWFVEQWAPDPVRRQDPELSPVHAPLQGLPPTPLVTAEHDPLKDEGKQLADLLDKAGVGAEAVHEPGLVHGFFGLSQISPAADAATQRIMRRFGEMLG